jgi:hypothetical protein
MNIILPEMPNLTGDVYAPVMPMWFVNGLRVFSILFSSGVAWLSYKNWLEMPTFAKVIVSIFVPVFFLSAFSAKKWWATYSVTPFFLADHLGMYFQRNAALLTYIGNQNQYQKNQLKQWLFVPWKHIFHVRVAKVSTSDGYADGAVFDVKASSEEVSAFFDDDIKDRMPIQVGMKAVCFYINFPPAPRKVVARVQEMQNKYNRTSRNLNDEQTN